MAKIKFGTDGWRGVISEDYTFANVRLVAAGIADWVKRREEQAKGIVVGYDGRFLSAKYAQDCAAVLADEGVKVWLADAMLSSPALTWQVKDRQAAGGVMITASHNPPEYNGLKFKAARPRRSWWRRSSPASTGWKRKKPLYRKWRCHRPWKGILQELLIWTMSARC